MSARASSVRIATATGAALVLGAASPLAPAHADVLSFTTGGTTTTRPGGLINDFAYGWCIERQGGTPAECEKQATDGR